MRRSFANRETIYTLQEEAIVVSRDNTAASPLTIEFLPIGQQTESIAQEVQKACPVSDIARKRMKSYRDIAAGLSVVYTGWDGRLVGGGRKRATALY